MKALKLLLSIIFIIGFSYQSEAQFLKKLKKKAENKIEREAEKRAQRRVDKKIDEGYDEIEDEIDGENNDKKKGKKEKDNGKAQTDENNQNTQENGTSQNDNIKKPTVVWSKFDFVPGDTVIFEDAPSADEENGEFPSRWDLYKGSVEIGELNGEPVIMFLDGGSYIIPYLKNSKEDYLPEVFTIEVDVWFGKSRTTANRFWIYLGDKKNNHKSKGANTSLRVMTHSLGFLDSEKDYPGTEDIIWTEETKDVWHHISIAYTKGKFKAYMDDTRLINVPHLEINPTGITFEAGKANIYLKNIRIAKGGVKYYDRVLSEGKIIVNGIKFDVNKATLKPESMGPINRIYKLMEKNPNINFSVEGHTDSDGNEASNLTLSKARGKAVMDKLISMGIASNRLKSNGFGESKPIGENVTPEGKANNRRVEFVKM